MKKSEFIKRYGLEAYQKYLEKCKQYRLENKERIQQYQQQYRQENREQILKYQQQYYQDNKERIQQYQQQYQQQHYKENREQILKYQQQYFQENKERIQQYQQQYQQQYRQENKERIQQYQQQYFQENKEQFLERYQEYYKTPIGRAAHLVSAYKRFDKKYNRGECTLTPQWVIDNIFSSKCVYCGETDWTKLGCDRIDNSLPHTEDNVVCCCGKCNVERHTTDFNVFLLQKGQEQPFPDHLTASSVLGGTSDHKCKNNFLK